MDENQLIKEALTPTSEEVVELSLQARYLSSHTEVAEEEEEVRLGDEENEIDRTQISTDKNKYEERIMNLEDELRITRRKLAQASSSSNGNIVDTDKGRDESEKDARIVALSLQIDEKKETIAWLKGEIIDNTKEKAAIRSEIEKIAGECDVLKRTNEIFRVKLESETEEISGLKRELDSTNNELKEYKLLFSHPLLEDVLLTQAGDHTGHGQAGVFTPNS